MPGSLAEPPWERDSGLGLAARAAGAHGRVPPGLLPPLAVSDLDRHEEGEDVQPAPGRRGPLPLVCLHADCPVLGLGQQGDQPGSRHCLGSKWVSHGLSHPNCHRQSWGWHCGSLPTLELR